MSPYQKLALSLLASVATAAPSADTWNPWNRCKEVNFSVSGSAVNYNATGTVTNTSVPDIPVSGSQTLAGYFCLPTVLNLNSTKLQVFRGSFFTNRESWTALGGTPLFSPEVPQYQPYNYSWFDYANALGYPTLAIDTLGDGASSRPDPVLVTQIPYDIVLYHNLIQQIKAGTTGQLPVPFEYLIHIGNSLGSIIGNNMAAYYPNDFNQIVLTGFTKQVQPSFPGVSLNAPAPAVLVNPVRFAGLPEGYVTSTNQTALTASFFGSPQYVDFDPEVAALFFQRRDVVSAGDVADTYKPSTPIASQYKGRVLVLTGENDQAFCGIGSSILNPATMCGPLLAQTAELFPAADYNYKSVPRTGHATILHKSSRSVFDTAHRFIAGAAFHG